MKTTKFLAMLLAAFTLSFTLAACGDDDDDNPNPNQGENTANIFKVGNQSVVFDNASWERLDWIPDNELRYQCIELRSGSEENPKAMLRIGLWAITPDGVVPTGTFKLDPANNSAVYGGGRMGETSIRFDLATEGNGSLKIKKEGNEYSLTIDPFIVQVFEGDTEKTVSTKLYYKGKIAVRQNQFHGE